MRPHALLLAFAAALFFLSAAAYPHLEEDLNPQLQDIARDYLSYPLFELAEDSMRWKYAYCEPLVIPGYELRMHSSLRERLSNSGKGPHSMELYRLYVKDIDSYYSSYEKKQPSGQVMVKETWTVREVPEDSLAMLHGKVTYNRAHNAWYTPVKRDRLFVMLKQDQSKGSDKGWVYAVMEATPSGGKYPIIQSGRIGTCMSCHRDAARDRTFGPYSQERE